MRGAWLALLILMVGCYGRPKTQVNSALLYHAAGLQPGQPAVVTFSALWCHPCREEIDSLNAAGREFSGIIQFKGFLVEGEEKGSAVQDSDVAGFSSFTGGKPEYAVHTDRNWQLFDSIHSPQGHSLPTLLIFDRSGRIQQVIQQSLDYESQLRPILVSLSQGNNTPQISPEPPPPPPPPIRTQNPTMQLTDSVGNWLARSEVLSQPALINNVTAAWQAGLTKYAFTETEVPLNSGKITFLWDGAYQNTPQNASWLSDTPVSVCTLKITFNPDGTMFASSGNCRQK